jgi:hypothetical protein
LRSGNRDAEGGRDESHKGNILAIPAFATTVVFWQQCVDQKSPWRRETEPLDKLSNQIKCHIECTVLACSVILTLLALSENDFQTEVKPVSEFLQTHGPGK